MRQDNQRILTPSRRETSAQPVGAERARLPWQRRMEIERDVLQGAFLHTGSIAPNFTETNPLTAVLAPEFLIGTNRTQTLSRGTPND